MISDLHVHTHYSGDSRAAMAEYCEEAILQGVKIVCFTEHVDYNKNDYCYGFYKPEAFFEEYRRIQQEYGDKITLLSGIEFSEPHTYPRELEQLSKLPYDYILGSVHYWNGELFLSEMEGQDISLEEAYDKYWGEVYKAVSYGGFDSMAHIDIPKRYYKKSYWDEEKLKDIFSIMKKNNISLEINTSSLRKGLTETMPGRDMLELYKMAGGRNITIGSDSHSRSELAKGYSEALDMLTPPLVNGFYKSRKFIALSE